jgi:hypothetical protein
MKQLKRVLVAISHSKLTRYVASIVGGVVSATIIVAAESWRSMLQNLLGEAIGIVITVLLIDRLIKRQQAKGWEAYRWRWRRFLVQYVVTLQGLLALENNELASHYHIPKEHAFKVKVLMFRKLSNVYDPLIYNSMLSDTVLPQKLQIELQSLYLILVFILALIPDDITLNTPLEEEEISRQFEFINSTLNSLILVEETEMDRLNYGPLELIFNGAALLEHLGRNAAAQLGIKADKSGKKSRKEKTS